MKLMKPFDYETPEVMMVMISHWFRFVGEREFEKAAAISVFNLKLKRAIQVLSAGTKINNLNSKVIRSIKVNRPITQDKIYKH